MKKLFLILCIAAYFRADAQTAYNHITPASWVLARTDTVDYAIKNDMLVLSLKIRNYKSADIAYPKKLNFKDGIIEADMRWTGKTAGGFLGIAFRIKDDHHYQVVYFRPESSNTINAIQYMPEKKAVFNWWDYEADKYQAKTTLPMHDWFHVKLVVRGDAVTVFINNQAKPAMFYKQMDNSLKEGSVGYWLGNSDEGEFKNLVVKGF